MHEKITPQKSKSPICEMNVVIQAILYSLLQNMFSMGEYSAL